MSRLHPRGMAYPLESMGEALGYPVSESTKKSLVSWLDKLVEWNARTDLTAARSDAELLDLMLADALVLARHVPQGARVIDVGSGAGAPGLPLALLRPDLQVLLVEPLVKRVGFLRFVQGSFSTATTPSLSDPSLGGRANFDVRRGKGEDLVEAGAPPKWDVAISRATLPPAQWLPLARLLAPEAWVLLAKEPPPEAPDMEVLYMWPRTSASRRACLYRSAPPAQPTSAR